MTRIIKYCFLVCFVTSVSSQSCSQSMSYISSFNWIPDTWRVILDSYSFEDLLGDTWITSDVDGNGVSFVNFGGVCSRGGTVCSGSNNNWVFSHYVQYDSAKEVYFNVSYTFFCGGGTCSHAYFTLYRYNRNSTSETERTNTLNYQYLTGSETTSQFGDLTSRFRVQQVERPSDFSGFYLGVQDTGTCGAFGRILVYYLVCLARVSGLVSFPETTVPPSSSSNNVFSGSCAPNSHAVTSLEVQINSTTGVCTDTAPGGARCECDAGYRLDNFTACEACPEGQYRAINDDQNSCNNCPSNSEARFANSSICSCLSGFYRTSQETPATGCTAPPGRVQSLNVVSKTSTSVMISWQAPSQTGGRSDLYYSIERTDPQLSGSTTKTVADNVPSTTTSYTISGLQPFQEYEIKVITHNGVSNQVPNTVSSRTSTTGVTTDQAMAGAVIVTNLCTAVIWQAPENPNGEITGYDVEISTDVMNLPSTQFYFITSSQQQDENAVARVRARNGAGAGQWSQQSAICPGSCTLSLNLTATNTSVTLQWAKPTGTSGDITYNIQLTGSGVTNSFSVTDGGATVTHTIPELTPFSSYSITVSGGAQSCVKTFATLEGVAGAVIVTNLCTAMVWQAPENPNGEITGYDVEISTNIVNLPSTQFYFITSSQQQDENAVARVRARNGAGVGQWSELAICPGSCTLSLNLIATNTSVTLQWAKPMSTSGDITYNIQLTGNGATNSFSVTDGGATVTYTIPKLTPFSSYSINISGGVESCMKMFATLEGVPSTPMDFKQYCDVVVWTEPTNILGSLKGYELQIKFENDDVMQTVYLEPSITSYQTTDEQRKDGVLIRVRANNTKNEGNWTSFFAVGCEKESASKSSSSSILSSVTAVDVVIIVIITAAVCIAICILIVVVIYVVYKAKSSKSGSHNHKQNNNDVKMSKLY